PPPPTPPSPPPSPRAPSRSSSWAPSPAANRRSALRKGPAPCGRTGERLAFWLDRSPGPRSALRSRGGRLLLAFARRLLPPRVQRRLWFESCGREGDYSDMLLEGLTAPGAAG